jgi:hypothetical protein
MQHPLPHDAQLIPYDFQQFQQTRWGADLFNARGEPMLKAYLAYFGFLFLLVRWWRQADPLRPARLNLWSVARVVSAAYLVTLFIAFPQPWGLMVAATVSIAVQLSSPWIASRQQAARAD